MKLLKQVNIEYEEDKGRFCLSIEYDNQEAIYIALEKSFSAKAVAEQLQNLADMSIQVAEDRYRSDSWKQKR